MNKVKKTMLAMVPVIASFAAAGMAIRCGHKGRFDQVDDGIVKLYTGFSSNNIQSAALKTLIDEYNKFIKGKSADEGYLPVEITYAPNGYNTNELSSKLNNRDKQGLFNIALNYPAAASIVSTYDMNLDIPEEVYNKLSLVDAFKGTNEKIAGNTENKKWVMPVSRSSEMGAVNKPVFGMLLKELKDNYGLKIAATGSEKLNKYLEAVTKFANDATEITTNIWKDKLTDANAKTKLKEDVTALGEINDTVLESYSKIIDLATLMKRAFPSAKDLYVLGFDSLANAFNSINSSLTKGKGNYVSKKSEDAFKKYGGYDFKSFYENKDSEEYKLFEKISNILIKGIQKGAIYIGGGGAYGSNLLTNHKLAISYGSTAGYTHTFIKSNSFNEYKLKKEFDEKENELQYANLIREDNTNGAFAGLTNNKGYKNLLWLSTDKGNGKVGKYDIVSPNAEVDAILKKWKTDGKLYGAVITSDNKLKEENGAINYDTNKTAIKDAMKFGEIKNHMNYIIPNSAINVKVLSAAQILNKAEADWISAPLKATGTADETTAVFVQGPSFITIHANEREDKATLKFIEWFASEKLKTVTIEHHKTKETYTDTKPIDAFNLFAGYTSPTTEYFSKTAAKLKLNEADTIAFNNFKKIDNQNTFSAEDIASPYSAQMRDAITDAGKAIVSISNKGELATFEKFLEAFKNSFSTAIN